MSTTDNWGDKLQHIVDAAADRLPEAVTTLVVGLIVVELLLLIGGLILRWTGARAGLRRVLKSLGRAFLFIVLFIAVFESLGLNSVLAALTGSTVVLALLLSTGVAPLVTDVIAGLFLGNDREFQPGATVRAGQDGTEGVIKALDARKVYLEDKSGKIHVLPNSLVEKNEWVILKSVNPRRSTKRRR